MAENFRRSDRGADGSPRSTAVASTARRRIFGCPASPRKLSRQARLNPGPSDFPAIRVDALHFRVGSVPSSRRAGAPRPEDFAPPRQAVAARPYALPQKPSALGKPLASGSRPFPREGAQAQRSGLRDPRSRVPQKTLRPLVYACLSCRSGRGRRFAPFSQRGLRFDAVALFADLRNRIGLYRISLRESRTEQQHRPRHPTNHSHIKLFGQGLAESAENDWSFAGVHDRARPRQPALAETCRKLLACRVECRRPPHAQRRSALSGRLPC